MFRNDDILVDNEPRMLPMPHLLHNILGYFIAVKQQVEQALVLDNLSDLGQSQSLRKGSTAISRNGMNTPSGVNTPSVTIV